MATSILKARILATFEFCVFSAPLPFPHPPANPCTHKHEHASRQQVYVFKQRRQMGSNPPGAPLLEDELDADSMMMSSDTKQLPGGPTRHAARRAAASSLLCHGSNCCQPHEASTLTKRKKCWHKIKDDAEQREEIIEEGRGQQER